MCAKATNVQHVGVVDNIGDKLSLTTTVRTKHNDTHSDQNFSESELFPSLRENAHETPMKRSITEAVELTFREFLVRMGVIIFETHCISPSIIFPHFSESKK